MMVWNNQWKTVTVLAEFVISQIISRGRSKRFPRKALSKSTWLLKWKKNKKKQSGRGNNLLMQDLNAIFHENQLEVQNEFYDDLIEENIEKYEG